MPEPFNPLGYSSLSKSLADALMSAELVPLAGIGRFHGNGVYALFYTGAFTAYAPLAHQNRKDPGSFPIYIGKAAKASRKGAGEDFADGKTGTALYNRVAGDHRRSIEKAENLDVADFSCRLLVLDSIWIPLAETALIAGYSPVWNSILDGFGNHDPGVGRSLGKASRWDVLHPGRGRETPAPAPFTAEGLSDEVRRYLVETMETRPV